MHTYLLSIICFDDNVCNVPTYLHGCICIGDSENMENTPNQNMASTYQECSCGLPRSRDKIVESDYYSIINTLYIDSIYLKVI